MFAVVSSGLTASASKHCRGPSRSGTSSPIALWLSLPSCSTLQPGPIESPIRGSGVFVGGHGDWEGKANGGTVRVSILRTGPICANGGIPAGTPDVISGGVFVISGAVVDDVVNLGPVATLGANDMVLDDWGDVRNWTAKAPVTSRGPNGIGFVNFGAMERLDVQAPIETFGPGARGFNLHDGLLERSSFASIATHGDGFIGIQVSKALPLLEVAGDISTDGGEGQSLVKGVRVVLKAVALSIKPGGRVGFHQGWRSHPHRWQPVWFRWRLMARWGTSTSRGASSRRATARTEFTLEAPCRGCTGLRFARYADGGYSSLRRADSPRRQGRRTRRERASSGWSASSAPRSLLRRANDEHGPIGVVHHAGRRGAKGSRDGAVGMRADHD